MTFVWGRGLLVQGLPVQRDLCRLWRPLALGEYSTGRRQAKGTCIASSFLLGALYNKFVYKKCSNI